jgi:CRISPR/Cas system-associated exonuclease Cas4 (RecB family)
MVTALQLPLFADESMDNGPDSASWQDSLQNIEWSYSKREALEQCPLRYYYEYFGANKKIAKQEAEKATLHLLKESSNRYLRTGEILHLVIGKYFRKPQPTDSRPWTLERASYWAKRLLHDDQIHSRQYPNLPTYDARFPPVLLREYIHERAEADRLYEKAEANMLQAITTFFTDDRFAEFRRDGKSTDGVAEQMIRLKTLPCKVIGKVDLAYEVDDRVTVVDWKSGRHDGSGEDSLQLAVYGLWAIEHFQCDVERLRVGKAYLASGNVTFFPINADILNAARIRIVQDAERMIVMEKYGRESRSDAFTPCLNPAICRMCAFRGVCYHD